MTTGTKEKITISDRRLIRTCSGNITNIHEHLRAGHQILATAPSANIYDVLTDPEHIREAGEMYVVCKKGKTAYGVYAAHVFFVPPGFTLI